MCHFLPKYRTHL